MSISKYVSSFYGLLNELKLSLSETEIDELRSDASAWPEGDWARFVRSNQVLIDDFFRSTPSQRMKLKKFQNPRLRRLLILASAQQMKAAILLAEKLMSVDLVGLSYREASQVSASQYYEIFYNFPGRYWPFDSNPPKGFRIDKNEYPELFIQD